VILYSRLPALYAHEEKVIASEVKEKTEKQQVESTVSWRWTFLFVALAATAVISPMLFWGNASGHDFQFHVASWLDVAGQWREGILYPRWAEWANWGYGEPRFIFYPPGSWMLGAALGSVLPWPVVPGAFIWLTLVGGGMGMWRLAREWLSGREAVAAAVFFAVNPYNLLIVYYRSDFAELLAVALFPLLVLGSLRVARESWRAVPCLALVFAAIWLCNAPAAVIATYSPGLLLIVSAASARDVRPLLAGLAAMATGFGLAAFYIVPAAWEQRWVQIAQVVSQELRPERNFIFAHAGDPEFILFNWKVSSVALGVMLITGVLAVLVSRRRQEFPELWWILVTLAGVSAFMMFSPSAIFWRLLPKLRFVQFPWRWLDALSVPFAFFAAAAFGHARRRWTLWVVILIVLAGTATAIARDAWWDSDDVTTLVDWVQSGFGYEGTDEYAPIGCDRYELTGVNADSEGPPQQPIAQFAKVDPDSDEILPLTGVEVRVEKWTAERRIFLAKTSSAIDLEVRLVNYPAWRAQIDGKEAVIQSERHNGQVILAIPAGQHSIDLSFRRPTDRIVGALISVLSVCSVVAVIGTRRRSGAKP
jgi:6-pyruvoyl-tetrahydropterin synthase related domain